MIDSFHVCSKYDGMMKPALEGVRRPDTTQHAWLLGFNFCVPCELPRLQREYTSPNFMLNHFWTIYILDVYILCCDPFHKIGAAEPITAIWMSDQSCSTKYCNRRFSAMVHDNDRALFIIEARN